MGDLGRRLGHRELGNETDAKDDDVTDNLVHRGSFRSRRMLRPQDRIGYRVVSGIGADVTAGRAAGAGARR